jgi:hypothetical protein
MSFEPTAPTASPADVRVFAEIGSMDDIHTALRARFDDLELSRATIDHAAGLTDGYAGKLLAVPPIKRFGQTSLFPTLEVAGLRLALIEDADALARTQGHPKRARNAVRQRVSTRLVEACRTEVLRELTSKAGKARMTKMTAAARKRIAKLAAKARWAKAKRGRKTA